MAKRRARSVATATLVRLAGKLRALKGQDLEEGVSTRLLVYCASLISGGMPVERAIRAAMIEPLTDDADVKQGIFLGLSAHSAMYVVNTSTAGMPLTDSVNSCDYWL